MRVVLNGTHGRFQVTLDMEKPSPVIEYAGRFYKYAGFQDGAAFYKEAH